MRGNRRDRNLADAERTASWNLCFWFLVAFVCIAFVAIFALPSEVGVRVKDDDDDGWGHSRDDDDGGERHRRVKAPAVPVTTTSPPKAGEKHVASVSETRLSHADVLHADYLGAKPKTLGCMTDQERTELRDASSNVTPVNVPHMHAEFNEVNGTVVFTVETDYISADAAFVLSFEPFEADLLRAVRGTCQSSAVVADNATYADLWAHAPNAYYEPSEIPRDVTKRGGAFALSDGWTVKALSCSRILYTLETSAHALKKCATHDGNLLVTFEAGERIALVSGTLWLNLVRPVSNERDVGAPLRHQNWPFSFALYVDTFESKIAIVDSAKMPIESATKESVLANAARVAEKKKAKGGTTVTSDDLQFGGMPWSTYTSLASTWFDSDGDAKHFGQERVVKTEMQTTRALRMHLHTTSTCDLRKAVDERALASARMFAPSYVVAGITMPVRKQAATKYGDFEVALVDFISVDKSQPDFVCEPHDKNSVECHQNITLILSPYATELYQGSFEVHLCDRDLSMCNVLKPAHTIRIDVAITDPSADVAEAGQLQLELSSHLNTAAAHRINELTFDGETRVCMQTFAVGPPGIVQSVDVRTIAAWLCVDDVRLVTGGSKTNVQLPRSNDANGVQKYLQSRAAPKTGCLARKHWAKLYDSTDSSVGSAYNVSVHEPGSYGSWSSAICFDASTHFIDSDGTSVHRTTQYYQSEVVAVPTEKRKKLSDFKMHRTFASFANAARETINAPHVDAALHRADDVRRRLTPEETEASEEYTLTSPELGNALKKLDADKRVARFNGVTFDVKPVPGQERRLHNVTERTGLWVVALCLLIGGCLTCILVWFYFLHQSTVN